MEDLILNEAEKCTWTRYPDINCFDDFPDHYYRGILGNFEAMLRLGRLCIYEWIQRPCKRTPPRRGREICWTDLVSIDHDRTRRLFRKLSTELDLFREPEKPIDLSKITRFYPRTKEEKERYYKEERGYYLGSIVVSITNNPMLDSIRSHT